MKRTLWLMSTMVLTILLAGGLALVAVSPAARADGDCQPSGSEVVCTFNFTGAAQSWTVPEGVTQATFDVYGAQGGSEAGGRAGGGLGGKASATIAVTPGNTLQINVGGAGNPGVGGGAGGAGGFNGGAAGGNGCFSGPGGGGGASDVRSGDFELADRVIVGGGGGGAGGFVGGAGGFGGGSQGGPGGNSGSGSGGGGGTSTIGGAGGVGEGGGADGDDGSIGTGGSGGAAPCLDSVDDAGGGGGGYYGGGGGGGGGFAGGGGGGGSGFGPSGVVFSEGGVRSGNGLVTITYTPPDTTPPDTRAPKVKSTFPRGGGEVGPAANIRATFSEDMRPASVINAFKLFKKGSTNQIDAQVSYDAATDIATLNPINNLRRGVTYKAVVTTEAKDMAGNRLDQDGSNAGLQQKVWFFEIDYREPLERSAEHSRAPMVAEERGLSKPPSSAFPSSPYSSECVECVFRKFVVKEFSEVSQNPGPMASSIRVSFVCAEQLTTPDDTGIPSPASLVYLGAGAMLAAVGVSRPLDELVFWWAGLPTSTGEGRAKG